MEWSNEPREVAQGIYHIELPTPMAVGPVNIYLLAGECVTLVDTGPLTEEAWTKLNQDLKRIGYDVREIRQIVLTHQHYDHCGLAERIRQISGARVLAHPFVQPYLSMDKQFMEFQADFFLELYLECGVEEASLQIINKIRQDAMALMEQSCVDDFLYHEQIIPHFPEWKIFYTPGHGQGHISLYRAEDRVMIGGDLLMQKISTIAHIEPPQDGTGSRPLTLAQYRTSLEMVSHMNIDVIFPGHGEAVINHRGLIQDRLSKHWKQANKIISLLKDEEKTAFELTASLFPHVPTHKAVFIVADTISLIDMLHCLHILKIQRRNGLLYYSA